MSRALAAHPGRPGAAWAFPLVVALVLLHALFTPGLTHTALPDAEHVARHAVAAPAGDDDCGSPQLTSPSSGDRHRHHPAERPCAAAAGHVKPASNGAAGSALAARAASHHTRMGLVFLGPRREFPAAFASFRSPVLRC